MARSSDSRSATSSTLGGATDYCGVERMGRMNWGTPRGGPGGGGARYNPGFGYSEDGGGYVKR